MKKIVTIFLFAIICVSHLNIIDAFVDITTSCKKENKEFFKNLATEEEDTEKENEGKSKNEKNFIDRFTIETPQFSIENNFISYRLALNINPYQEDDIQPPKAV